MTDYLNTTFHWDDPNLVSAYDELPLWSAHFGTLLLQHLPLAHGLRVLDLACGTGFPALELAQVLGRTCQMVGLDPWLAALKRARFKSQTHQIQRICFIAGDGAAMPFDNAAFDRVVSNLGINNFDQPVSVLKECQRVLKPEGLLAITTNLQGHMQEFYEVYRNTLIELGREAWIAILDRHIHHRVTIEALQQMFEIAGLIITRVFQDTFTMRFLDGSSLFHHHFIQAGFLDGWRSAVPPSGEQEVFERLELNLNDLAAEQGEITLSIPVAYVEAIKPV